MNILHEELRPGNCCSCVINMLTIQKISDVKFEENLLRLKVHFNVPNLDFLWIPSYCVPQHVRLKFYHKLSLPNEIIEQNKVKFLIKICATVSDSILNAICHNYITKRGLQLPEIDMNDVREKLTSLPSECPSNEDSVGLLYLVEAVLIEEVKQRRSKELPSLLKLAEREANLVIDSFKAIQFINIVNLVLPPKNFTFVNNSTIPDYLLKDPIMTAEGCSCIDCCCSATCNHPGKVAYKLDGKLKKPDYYLTFNKGTNRKPRIHQCNINCKCGPRCCNRIAENGTSADLILYQMINGTGWGVLAGSEISKGTFLGRYVGALMSYNDLRFIENSLYIFDLVVDEDTKKDVSFGIDAKNIGSITRFFNHSCDPNVGVASVHIASSDPRLFEISFFTQRNVRKGEQLCINYGSSYKTGDTCKCGSVKCKNPFQNNEIEKTILSRSCYQNPDDSFDVFMMQEDQQEVVSVVTKNNEMTQTTSSIELSEVEIINSQSVNLQVESTMQIKTAFRSQNNVNEVTNLSSTSVDSSISHRVVPESLYVNFSNNSSQVEISLLCEDKIRTSHTSRTDNVSQRPTNLNLIENVSNSSKSNGSSKIMAPLLTKPVQEINSQSWQFSLYENSKLTETISQTSSSLFSSTRVDEKKEAEESYELFEIYDSSCSTLYSSEIDD